MLFSINTFSSSNFVIPTESYFFSNNDFIWPLPGFHTITSHFGKRNSPTSGSSSNHSGIDIAAPEGTNIYSVSYGIVSYIGFNGANGYTITIENSNYSFSYCHVSPNFIITYNQNIESGKIIGYVGPKNVYTVPNNPYKDSNGNPTNGATTGCHLHLTIKKDGIAVNPLNYFKLN